MMRRATLLFAILCGLLVSNLAAQQAPTSVPDQARQLIVAVADGWNTHRGQMWLYQREQVGGAWTLQHATATPVLFGKSGMAWGRGLLAVPHGQAGIPSKVEKDRRTPAGCFRIGMLYGHAPAKPAGALVPYHQVTARDCWIDDPNHPNYNQHVIVDPANPPPWYAKQRMRLGDFAYEWLLEIRHNSDPPVKGAGSAIFFHVRRGENSATAGCTTMHRENLLGVIRWLKPEMKPHFVVLPRAEYLARIKSWKLPPLPK